LLIKCKSLDTFYTLVMKTVSLYLTEANVFRRIEEILPPLQADEVLVKTLYGAVSLGTELLLYTGTSRSSEPAFYPRMTGYESYGVIEAVGDDVQNFRVGEKVVTFYGHKTRAVVKASKLIPVPAPLSPTLALLAILSCDVKKGISKLNLQPDESVLLTGAGAIGLLTLFILKALGVQAVDVLEPQANRRDLALALGARNMFDADKFPLLSYKVGIECSSRNAAFSTLQTCLKHYGRICVLADGNMEPLVLLPAFHEKELRVVGSSDGVNYQEHAAWFYTLPNLQLLEKLFDLETTFENLPTTFETLASRKTSAIKVLVKYK
jgi:alcohol dehydrogenase